MYLLRPVYYRSWIGSSHAAMQHSPWRYIIDPWLLFDPRQPARYRPKFVMIEDIEGKPMGD